MNTVRTALRANIDPTKGDRNLYILLSLYAIATLVWCVGLTVGAPYSSVTAVTVASLTLGAVVAVPLTLAFIKTEAIVLHLARH